ncbi:MAG TPA: PD-(D/E)XK nuclease family protein, partial [Vicinamibacterales bacterium]|nr:PD-(D/E)XK nuclease family protein [Vicinamibacterales bacterium]
GGNDVVPADVAALHRALSEAGYLGQLESLEVILTAWRQQPSPSAQTRAAVRAGATLVTIAHELDALRSPAPTAEHLTALLDFLLRHERTPEPDDPLRDRQQRARAGIHSTLTELRDAFARFDAEPVAFDAVTALVRRRIGGHTFAPRTGKTGVHLLDADSARFGEFDVVQLAGLVDGEWPEPPRRNIFYSPEILRELGWPSLAEQRQAARSRFVDLLHLPSSRVIVSTFSLEGDAIVSPSSLLDELEAAGLETVDEPPATARIFDHEALGLEPVSFDTLQPAVRAWAVHRAGRGAGSGPRFHGWTEQHRASAYSLTALERYQDCPFKFFSADVLGLEEAPEDETTLSPRARGRLVHEVLQRFFEAWDARGGGPITPARLDAARAMFAEVAAPLLDRLGDADARLERLQLFGSAISVGAIDVVLGLEASRPMPVQERWLEYRLEGTFSLGVADRQVPLRGVADRIDLLSDRRLRVIDYKSGAAPDPKRALQAPIYALCAAERLEARDGRPWTVDEASYVALSGRRASIPVVEGGDADGRATLDGARSRLLQLLDGIHRGEFPPRPHDPMICRFCAFSSVCRKDYVGDA